MPILSKMERMAQERREAQIDPVLDEYNVGHGKRFSTRFVIATCSALFVLIILLFLPFDSAVLTWVRAIFVVCLILGVIALLFDRSSHLRR